MGSGTQVDQDDSKAAVEIFKNRLEVVEAEIKQSKQRKEAQAAELFEAARVQRAMVFELGDEPIPGIDLESSNVRSASIALNSSARKRKRDADLGPSSDAVLLAEAFEKSTGVLAKALVAGRSSDSSSVPASPSLPSVIPTSSLNNLGELNQRMTKVESGPGDMKSELGDMKSELGDMKTMLGRIFAAVSSGQANTPTDTSSRPFNMHIILSGVWVFWHLIVYSNRFKNKCHFSSKLCHGCSLFVFYAITPRYCYLKS